MPRPTNLPAKHNHSHDFAAAVQPIPGSTVGALERDQMTRARLPLPRRPLGRTATTIAMAGALVLLGAVEAMAQASSGRALISRTELEAFAASVERAAASGGGDQQRAEAAALRERLRDGDFKVGDKIVLHTANTFGLPEQTLAFLNDTVVVRDARVIRMPNMSDLSLTGVLRSELDSAINAHVARYLRNVRIHAEPLVQVLVSGPVGSPGYLYLAPDMLVADVLNRAGPSSSADLTRTQVKRIGKVIVKGDSLQSAIRSGATLDRMDLESGDEVAVAERKAPRDWRTYLGVVTAIGSLSYLILRLTGK
jgi:protein involved in polysaccharide export with SLBB domain